MHRTLLLLTTVFLSFAFLVAIYKSPQKKRKIIDTTQFVTMGSKNAPVHMILFEEFACVQCKRFHLEDLPLIEEKYINKGLVKLTTIPLSYFQESTAAFVATCCVTNEGLEHHKAFLDHLYSLREDEISHASPKELVRSYALKHQNINMRNVLGCLKSEKVYEILNANIKLSDDIHEGDIAMPSILINGRFVKKIDIEVIMKMIEQEIYKASYYVETA